MFTVFLKILWYRCPSWINLHSGSFISMTFLYLWNYIYDISANVKDCLPKTLTSKNIIAAFRKASIWPFNRSVFRTKFSLFQRQDSIWVWNNNDLRKCYSNYLLRKYESTINQWTINIIFPERNLVNMNEENTITPEDVKLYPKAYLRKANNRRKKGNYSHQFANNSKTTEKRNNKLRKKKENRCERKKVKLSILLNLKN